MKKVHFFVNHQMNFEVELMANIRKRKKYIFLTHIFKIKLFFYIYKILIFKLILFFLLYLDGNRLKSQVKRMDWIHESNSIPNLKHENKFTRYKVNDNQLQSASRLYLSFNNFSFQKIIERIFSRF